jgi:hypothetical protein
LTPSIIKQIVLQEKILILDFGSQYTQLIARRIRELNVYCEIYPFNHFPDPDNSVKGVVLSGSPSSVRDKNAPAPDLSKINGKIPMLFVTVLSIWYIITEVKFCLQKYASTAELLLFR